MIVVSKVVREFRVQYKCNSQKWLLAGASKYLVSSKYYLYVRNKEKKEMEREENVPNIVL